MVRGRKKIEREATKDRELEKEKVPFPHASNLSPDRQTDTINVKFKL